jgi:hypothetical protein
MSSFKPDPSRDSSFLAKLVEHIFIAEMLQETAFVREQRLEVSRPEVDMAGYDMQMECGGVIRHVRLKASQSGVKTAFQNVHCYLADKPSGCVVWIFWDFTEHRIVLSEFRFFGSSPGQPLPSLSDYKPAKHTKADSTGKKNERPLLCQVPKTRFAVVATVSELVDRLFG